MPQGGEAGAAMHPPHDPFRLGVHAFGAAVVVWQGHRRVHGFFVQVEAAGEGVQVGQSVARTAAIHSPRRPGLPWRGVQAAGLFSREASIIFGPRAVRTKDGLQNKNDETMVCRVHEPGRRMQPSRWSRPRRTSAVPSSRRSADPTPTKSSTATAKPLPSRRSMPGFGIPGQNRATCSGQGQSAVARPARSAGL
jgi:hypothetical protein